MRFARLATVPFRFFALSQNSASRRQFLPSRHFAFIRFLTVALLLFAAAGPALSQSDRGAIAGTVLDATGAAVEGATVTATDTATSAVYTATTGPTGGYRLEAG